MTAHRIDSTGREVVLEIGADAVTPGCDVYRTTDQAVGGGAATAVNWEAAALNEDTMWVAGTPSRITAKRPGYYRCAGQATLSIGGTSISAALRVNGTTYVREVTDTTGASGRTTLVVSGLVYLNAGDYVELLVFSASAMTVEGDNSVASLSTLAGVMTRLSVSRLGPSLIVPPSQFGVQLDYAQAVGNITVSATAEGTPSTILTGASVAYDGQTRVRVEFWNACVVSTGAAIATLLLQRDGTNIGSATWRWDNAGLDDGLRVLYFHDTPAAGSHVYSVKGWVNAGSISLKTGSPGQVGTVGSLPTYMRVTKEG